MRLTSCVVTASTALLLAGCAAGGSEVPSAENPPTEQPNEGISVATPKDAAAPAPCELLPAEVASQVGLEPEGELLANNLDPSLPDSCDWKSADGSLSANVVAVDGRSLQQYYDTKDQYQTYEEFQIAGNPAVIAVESDARVSCDVWMATNPDQVVGSTVFLPNEDVGKVDPCEVNKKMFELSMPSWPAA